MRLNQLLAVEKGLKSTAETNLTALYQKLQKPALLSGLTRTYQPRDAEDPDLPPPNEGTRVQLRAEETLAELATTLAEFWDATAAKEATNRLAAADVILDGKVFLKEMPATLLLFLEKQLVGLTTYIEKLPVLDPAEEWQYEPSAGVYATPVQQTIRTKKVPRILVKAQATDKHPAQVDTWLEDVGVGTWNQRKFSGAIPEARRQELKERVAALAKAVKVAREQANLQEVVELKIGQKVFDFLFAKK